MSENKADPLRDILRCIETIEGAYNFECEAGPLKNCGEWKYLKRLCGVGATPQPPAPDHLPLPFESAGMRGARKQAERDHASMFPQPAAPLVRDLCGDDLNGGLIRDLCFTVWKICHEPKHSDGNSDWGSDTLPVVQEAVRAIREKLDAALSADIIPQPAAPLGGREAIARLIRKALVENWRDAHDGRKWDEDVLLTGCRKVGGGMGYHKPDEAAQRLALDAADAILAAIPQERGVDRAVRCTCGIMCQDLGKDAGCRYLKPEREALRKLVDVVYQHATERTTFPATVTADLLIDRAFGIGAIAAYSGVEREAAIIEECAKVVDLWIKDFGSIQTKHLNARSYAVDAVADVAEAIRALAGKETDQ